MLLLSDMTTAKRTGIKVIIVGAGFAGLACAIECKRKGHEPVVLEKFSELKPLGAPQQQGLYRACRC